MINFKRLRCFVGWLAILLAIIVLVQSLIYNNRFPCSISETYYSEACIAPFMIILGIAAALLMYYNGYDKTDDILNTIAGILGLCICLFPCDSDWANRQDFDHIVGTFQIPIEVSGWIHNIAAALFFVLLAYISFFQFTKTSGEMTKQKKIRNKIYRVCACGMLGAFLILLIPESVFAQKVWLTEVIALAFFGISWLTKADAYKWLAADPKIKEIKIND